MLQAGCTDPARLSKEGDTLDERTRLRVAKAGFAPGGRDVFLPATQRLITHSETCSGGRHFRGRHEEIPQLTGAMIFQHNNDRPLVYG